MATLALMDTIHAIIPEIETLCQRFLPGVQSAHFPDETILREPAVRGRMDANIVRRLSVTSFRYPVFVQPSW